MTPEPDRLHCACGTPLGDAENPQWVVYPNPLLCPACGADNSARVLPHITAQTKKGKKR